MPASIHHGLRSPEDLSAFGRIVGWAFGFPEKEASEWLEHSGTDNLRLYSSDGAVRGGLLTIPMGQYFGGKAVPMVGIAGVAAAPEARGKGLALELMHATVRELHDKGVALSTLYPATLTLYRKAGYALAGSLFDVRMPAARIGISEPNGDVRPADDSDVAEMQALYARVARTRDGYLARGPYIWQRVQAPRSTSAQPFVVERDGKLEGYVYLSQKRKAPGENFDLALADVTASSAWAAKKVLAFLYGHRSVVDHVSWRGSSADPLLLAIPERVYEVRLREHWMTRICHVQGALEARGYPAGLTASLELDVHDPHIPENSGRIVLTVENGRGHVSRGGSGKLRLSVESLAALYTGFQSPEALARSGSLTADDASVALARALLSGPPPEMPDFF